MKNVMFGLCVAILVVAVGCGDEDSSPTNPGDNDSFQKSQLVGTWVRESDTAPVIVEKIFTADGVVTVKEFRKSEPPPARGVEMRFHRYHKNLPLAQQTEGAWDIRGGKILYRLKLPNGTEMTQQYQVERVSASEFVQSSQGVDGKVEESYLRGKAWQAGRPIIPASGPASRPKK